MTFAHRFTTCLLLLTGVFVTSAASQRKVSQAIVSGIVVDGAGVAVPDTIVKLTSQSGHSFETMSDEDGRFRLGAPAGTYKLYARYQKHNGWNIYHRKRLNIPLNGKRLRIELKVNPNGGAGGLYVTGEPIKNPQKDNQ